MESSTPQPAIKSVNVSKRYGNGDIQVHALRQVSLTVQPGRFVAVMGPSGSGKSTLMHVLAGLDAIDDGEIWLDGVPINQLNDNDLTRLRRDRVGFIFQAFNLLPMLTAKQNILLPLTISKQPVEQQWFDMIVHQMSLADRLSHKPSELSGGQQQRVAIARALVTKPAVIFADEPTGNLDSASSATILTLLRDSVDQLGQTVIMVTHDPKAATIADEVIILADGQICQVLQHPDTDALLASVSTAERQAQPATPDQPSTPGQSQATDQPPLAPPATGWAQPAAQE